VDERAGRADRAPELLPLLLARLDILANRSQEDGANIAPLAPGASGEDRLRSRAP